MLRNSPQTGTGDIITSVQALEPHLIPNASLEQKQLISDLVDKCIDALKINKSSDISIFEKTIDNIIFNIIGLTEKEREIILNKILN